MTYYIYDGTFEGLFTVISQAIEEQWEIADVAGIASQEPLQLDLFTETKTVFTDAIAVRRFFDNQLLPWFSREILTDIIYCSHSGIFDAELLLLRFIYSLITEGEKISFNMADPTVSKITRIREQVAHEIHRYHGFIRFRKLSQGLYYAPIEPDHNVVRFLAPHFKARFADQSWLIHDLKRKTGIYYDQVHCSYLPDLEMLPEIAPGAIPYVPQAGGDIFSPQEQKYQELWNEYFQHIAIRERENRRAQRQRMPERYWRHLVERVEE